MAPNQETLMVGSYSKPNNNNSTTIQKPPRLSMETLQRSFSDISFELRKEAAAINDDHDHITKLPPISEVEDAKCECCGMCEECTPEYINGVRDKFSGKLVCGLCGEAVKEEMEKNGGKIEEALNEHMSVCVRFNRFSRAYPVLYQAAAMKELFKKSNIRAKSMSPRVKGGTNNRGGLTRSTSCIPAITRDVGDRKMVD